MTLVWEYEGQLRAKEFTDPKAMAAFSRRLIAAGLTPRVTESTPTIFDQPKGTA